MQGKALGQDEIGYIGGNIVKPLEDFIENGAEWIVPQESGYTYSFFVNYGNRGVDLYCSVDSTTTGTNEWTDVVVIRPPIT